MIKMRHTPIVSIRLLMLLALLTAQLLILLVILTAVPVRAFAKDGTVEIPEHASAKKYGSGWECDRGYREINGACAAVKVPANAYPTNVPYGRGWECVRGYRKVDETCAAIKVPPNAYLNSSGDRWKCDRGYRKVDDACIAVKVPANGYFVDSSYEVGWKCERGYRAVNETCVAVKVPENAHLDYSGNEWDCNRPYQKQQDGCVLR